jgi:hypothetical protein
MLPAANKYLLRQGVHGYTGKREREREIDLF